MLAFSVLLPPRQTRDVLIKRFCFRKTVEENIVKLHDEVKAGRIQIVDGVFDTKALKILTK